MESGGFGESLITAFSGLTKRSYSLAKRYLCREHFLNIVRHLLLQSGGGCTLTVCKGPEGLHSSLFCGYWLQRSHSILKKLKKRSDREKEKNRIFNQIIC